MTSEQFQRIAAAHLTRDGKVYRVRARTVLRGLREGLLPHPGETYTGYAARVTATIPPLRAAGPR